MCCRAPRRTFVPVRWGHLTSAAPVPPVRRVAVMTTKTTGAGIRAGDGHFGDGAAPAVSFTGAVKAFGDVRAVDGLDLTIGAGETVALLGRNGAGKSTTISLLLGLDDPDEGGGELFGAAPRASVRAGRVGAMLQEGRAVPRVTVAELVGFVARRYPEPMEVAQALRLAGIEE